MPERLPTETREGPSFPVALMLYKLCFVVYIFYHIHGTEWLLTLVSILTFISFLFSFNEARKAHRKGGLSAQQPKKSFIITLIQYCIVSIYVATLATLLYIISSKHATECPPLLVAEALPFLLALFIYLFRDSSALDKN